MEQHPDWGDMLCGTGAFVPLHIYPAPQHVDSSHAAWRVSDAVLAELRGDLCRILHLDFRE
jgi:hypothetical protein